MLPLFSKPPTTPGDLIPVNALIDDDSIVLFDDDGIVLVEEQ